MNDSIHQVLAPWANFYLITGSAAAALTGLQFIVQTLIASAANRAMSNDDPEGATAAFGTPTVVHLSAALVLSALMCAPWSSYGNLRVVLGVLGSAAVVYSLIVLRRARRQQGYVPTAYDWTFHVALPTAAYASVVLVSAYLERVEFIALEAMAATTLVLLCLGIHNAWDTVTYLTIRAMTAPSHDAAHAAPAAKHPPQGSRKRRRAGR